MTNVSTVKATDGSIKEYDENEHVIHSKYSYRYEEWWEYDEKGNEIRYKDSDGDERYYEYNKKKF